MACAHPSEAFIDQLLANGYKHYIGHAEPTAEFFSTQGASAYNMQWKFSLPATDPTPTQNGSSVANFELFVAQWLGMALCDPNSNPYGPCTPISDSNDPNTAGSAFLELQFFPPGLGGCGSTTQWCVLLHINTAEKNIACGEPTTAQLVTTNGTVGGPLLLMSDGDNIQVTFTDTPVGLRADVNDLTSATTGFMVASGANGFVHNTDPTTCTTEAFNFRAEYATAKPGNIVPWTGLQINLGFDFEIGHFELCGDSSCSILPDGADEGNCSVTTSQVCNTNTPNCPAGETCVAQTSCPNTRGIGGCFNQDNDQDGTPYQPDWADGTSAHPSSYIIGASNNQGVGPLGASPSSPTNYNQGYNTITFDTTEGTSAPTFYPFFSQAGTGAACRFNFGNDIPGTTTNDFSGRAQFVTTISNPCFPGPVARCQNVTTPANASCQGVVTPAEVNNGSSEPAGDPLTFSLNPTGPFSLGTTPVTLTATDTTSGATSTCTATVTVVDTTPPTVVAPPNVDLAICDAGGLVTVGTPTTSDICNVPLTVTGEVISRNGVALSPPIPVVNGQVALGFGTYVIQWTASDGTNTSKPVFQTVTVGPHIQANGNFLVDNSAFIKDATGGPGQMLNSGNGETQLGVASTSGSITSVASVSLENNARVTGNVITAGTISLQSGATISGTRTQHASVVLPALPTLPTFPPPVGPNITVNSGTQTLTPGSYPTVTLNSGATLIMTAGDFFIQNFFINSSVNVRLQVTPNTRVFVQNQFAFRSPFVNSSGVLQPILLGFAGTSLTVETTFNGTLLAPNGSVTFGISSGVNYHGAFFAQNIEVRPDSALFCDDSVAQPLPEVVIPATCSDGVKDGNETDVDCGGSCVACPNGKDCLVNSDCQNASCVSGICQEPTGQVSASLTKTTDWGSGYCVTLEVTDLSPMPTKSWSVTVNTGQSTIYDSWNGNFPANTGTFAITPGFTWNQVIAPGTTNNSVGFCANRTPANSGANAVVVSASGSF